MARFLPRTKRVRTSDLNGRHPEEAVGKKTLRLLCVLGVSAVSSLLDGIPPPRRRDAENAEEAQRKTLSQQTLGGVKGAVWSGEPFKGATLYRTRSRRDVSLEGFSTGL
jgi:hypothetical protein